MGRRPDYVLDHSELNGSDALLSDVTCDGAPASALPATGLHPNTVLQSPLTSRLQTSGRSSPRSMTSERSDRSSASETKLKQLDDCPPGGGSEPSKQLSRPTAQGQGRSVHAQPESGGGASERRSPTERSYSAVSDTVSVERHQASVMTVIDRGSNKPTRHDSQQHKNSLLPSSSSSPRESSYDEQRRSGNSSTSSRYPSMPANSMGAQGQYNFPAHPSGYHASPQHGVAYGGSPHMSMYPPGGYAPQHQPITNGANSRPDGLPYVQQMSPHANGGNMYHQYHQQTAGAHAQYGQSQSSPLNSDDQQRSQHQSVTYNHQSSPQLYGGGGGGGMMQHHTQLPPTSSDPTIYPMHHHPQMMPQMILAILVEFAS